LLVTISASLSVREQVCLPVGREQHIKLGRFSSKCDSHLREPSLYYLHAGEMRTVMREQDKTEPLNPKAKFYLTKIYYVVQ